MKVLVILGLALVTLDPLTALHSPICRHKGRAVLSDNGRGTSADLSGLLAFKAVSQIGYSERRHYLDQRDSPRNQSQPNLFCVVYRCTIRHSDSSKSLKRVHVVEHK